MSLGVSEFFQYESLASIAILSANDMNMEIQNVEFIYCCEMSYCKERTLDVLNMYLAYC